MVVFCHRFLLCECANKRVLYSRQLQKWIYFYVIELQVDHTIISIHRLLCVTTCRVLQCWLPSINRLACECMISHQPTGAEVWKSLFKNSSNDCISHCHGQHMTVSDECFIMAICYLAWLLKENEWELTIFLDCDQPYGYYPVLTLHNCGRSILVISLSVTLQILQ